MMFGVSPVPIALDRVSKTFPGQKAQALHDVSFVMEPSDTVLAPRMLVTGEPARDRRPLSDAELSWTANGLGVYQELARRSLATMRPVAPLTELPAERQRLAVDASASASVPLPLPLPLREYRSSMGPTP